VREQFPAIVSSVSSVLIFSTSAFAQRPTPTYGWNLGNTLEAPDGEGTWSPLATQSLINTVADSGFNVVRLPVAWNSHANQSTYQIDAGWMARVKQVVDWCQARKLTVIINSHWDRGWLEKNITDTVDPTINAKMQSYWTQVANTFKTYDNRLLFAGTNEPHCETAAQWTTLLAYHQTFVNAVRATGGNNSNRWLVIQGPKTDINLTDKLVTSLPSDSASGRLAVEVHYYDPFSYTLQEKDETWGKMIYFWGQGYHHATRTDRNAKAEAEAHVDAQFQKMADKFVSRGIPVIIGEFAARKRRDSADLTGTDLNLHLASRTYFHRYVVNSANSKGLKPIYWDIAGTMFDWSTGAITDKDTVRALTGGPALPPPPRESNGK
jgi:aryl-phospho-beta-D-glucosidase BglC (GH1 family)